ncbi:hypothetical protein D1Y85_12260 [Paraburkholderia dinghuensis]|uniref:Uncharacterized protein n=2 Tax=Paraburkholderia dinghuensis TaxID=2305225 RepID=A0A3N6MSI1_9BURK|nr:hypothetical protein D1Y85_12260 [Paraburkholderia dinghuensis]
MDMPWNELMVFAAGAAGSLLRVVVMPPASRLLLAAHVGLGALMAIFVAPAIVEEWFTGHGPGIQRGIAFVVGVLGPLAGEIVLRVVERRGDDVAERLLDRFGGKDDRR